MNNYNQDDDDPTLDVSAPSLWPLVVALVLIAGFCWSRL